MQLVNAVERDPSQAAPAFCGIATESQKKLILPTLRKMYESMQAQAEKAESSADNPLNWSSFTLPYLEAVWASGDRELVSMTVEAICNRIYASMDRRDVDIASGSKRPKLGWPGVSCEIWGAHGAFGGEVYGWGAVMPAHIVRNLIGFRETDESEQIILSPGFGPSLSGTGKQYGISNLHYAKQSLGLHFTFVDERKLRVEIELPGGPSVLSVTDESGQPLQVEQHGERWQF